MNVLPSIFTGAHPLDDTNDTRSRGSQTATHPKPTSQSSPLPHPNLPWPIDHLHPPLQPPRRPPNPSNPQATPPFLAKSKKRALSKLPANLPLLTGQPPYKRPRHRVRAQRTTDCSRYPPASLDDARLSPSVFFHDPSTIRPTLPLRLSGSEPARKMLRRGVKDDSGGGFRTLKLARGSFKLGNPTGAAGTPSAPSSASGSSMDIDDAHPSPGLSVLCQVGITELLDQDERLTFVIDLADQANFEPGPLNTVFANVALKSTGGLYDLVCGKTDQSSPGLAAATAFTEFKNWATSYVRNHQSLDIGLPSFFYLGTTWTCCTLRKRLRLIKGTPGSAAGNPMSNPPSVGFPTSLISARDGHRHTSSVYEMAKGSQNEPLDYFGNFKASLPAVSSPTQTRFDYASPMESTHLGTKKAGKKLSRRSEEGLHARTRDSTPRPAQQSSRAAPSSPLSPRPTEPIMGAAAQGEVGKFSIPDRSDSGFFDWTRLPITPALPPHIQFTRSVDWAATKLGPIEAWSVELRGMCNLIMASPHPAAMYWGEDLIAIYNEAYVLLGRPRRAHPPACYTETRTAGQKHPSLMGQSYKTAWAEIWSEVVSTFQSYLALNPPDFGII